MNNKFFLYMDILGFTDLVQNNSEKIHDLYEVIASLNAHNHDAFKVVVFSDTVIVYNVNGGDTAADAKYLVMFMCEFVKDLMHRLMGRNIYFRAVITHGDFTHYELNGMPCFFGNALVDAYHSEKELKAIGLFIDKKISKYCHIFKSQEYNENFDFVYVTQALDEIEYWGDMGYPIVADLIESTDSKWHLAPELDHVLSMLKGASDVTLPDSVRLKYKASWDMYSKHYPNITDELAISKDITSISPEVDWQEVIDRHPEDCSYAIESRVEF
ncbi:hypothetical protein VSAK1_25420 [Vibrio mediterranei AK1]|uniref:hypothetical protein n=1 Tax=Vibrio mediterranei TaxID=689 RepID=UPI00015420A0|nr:hypothetical protein [Vibrio mediterranei]EDL51369.1 hypothetical protein VSAK1_25420 [Vibrio mediterranei AK1]